LAVAVVLDERPVGEAAALNGMNRQTLRDWVHHYNADSVTGLKSRQPPGHRSRMSVMRTRASSS